MPDINYQLPQPLKDLLADSNPWPTPNLTPKIVAKGSIIAFNYTGSRPNYQIHDPYPLVVVSDIFTTIIRGFNLHMLTTPYIKTMVKNFGNNQRFSYANIKGDTYITSAFRSYKRSNISSLRMLDITFIQKLMKIARSLEPGEIEQMRSQIQNAIKAAPQQPKAQPKAQPGEQVIGG